MPRSHTYLYPPCKYMRGIEILKYRVLNCRLSFKMDEYCFIICMKRGHFHNITCLDITGTMSLLNNCVACLYPVSVCVYLIHCVDIQASTMHPIIDQHQQYIHHIENIQYTPSCVGINNTQHNWKPSTIHLFISKQQ